MGRYRSGQPGQTVNLLTYVFIGSNPILPTIFAFSGFVENPIRRVERGAGMALACPCWRVVPVYASPQTRPA